jgi:hypothetical protein
VSLTRRVAVVASLTAALPLVTAAPAAAHQGWFVHHPEQFPLDWSALTAPATVAGSAAVVAVALLWRAVVARLPRPELSALQRLQPLVPYVPRLLAAHLGASLLLPWSPPCPSPPRSPCSGPPS